MLWLAWLCLVEVGSFPGEPSSVSVVSLDRKEPSLVWRPGDPCWWCGEDGEFPRVREERIELVSPPSWLCKDPPVFHLGVTLVYPNSSEASFVWVSRNVAQCAELPQLTGRDTDLVAVFFELVVLPLSVLYLLGLAWNRRPRTKLW